MGSEPLALKYRPRTFEDLTGQVVVQKVLQKMILDKRMRPALLFTGVRGTGKTTTGRIVAAAMNCSQFPQGPCTECASCKAIESGTSLDVMEIDGATSGLVADIRQITEMVQYSVGGRYRVVLIDEAHSMSREGFNALLKTLEEPPPNTIFILLTTEPGKILETIVSRCMTFEFRRIALDDIVGRLRYIVSREGLGIEDDLIAHLAERSQGGMRDAVMALDQCSVAGVSTLADFQSMLGESDYAPELITALSRKDMVRALEVVDGQMSRIGDPGAVSAELVRCLRDVLVVQCGGRLVGDGEFVRGRERLADSLDRVKVYAGLRVLWDLKTRVRSGDSPRVMLDLAVVMLSEALAGKEKSEAVQGSSPPAALAKLTLDQMRSMA